MSLAGLETAIAEFVGDVLVNECGRPVPDRVLRYHGTLPHDCCSENGTLAVSWATVAPASNAVRENNDCATWPQVEIRVRYVVCWPVPDATENGIVLADNDWDNRAAILADVADEVARSLIAMPCVSLDDPLAAAVVAATVNRQIRFVAAEPIPAQGGCAGVQWRLSAGVRFGGSAS